MLLRMIFAVSFSEAIYDMIESVQSNESAALASVELIAQAESAYDVQS